MNAANCQWFHETETPFNCYVSCHQATCYLDLFSMYSRTNVSNLSKCIYVHRHYFKSGLIWVRMYNCQPTSSSGLGSSNPAMKLAQPQQNSSKFLTSHTKHPPIASIYPGVVRTPLRMGCATDFAWPLCRSGGCGSWIEDAEDGGCGRRAEENPKAIQLAANWHILGLRKLHPIERFLGFWLEPFRCRVFFRWDEIGSFVTLTTADFERHVSPKTMKITNSRVTGSVSSSCDKGCILG